MAKKGTVLYRLLSSAGTGYYYVGEKNTKFLLSYYLFKLINIDMQLEK